MGVIYAKTAIGVGCFLALLLVTRWQFLYRMPSAHFLRLSVSALFLTRAFLFVFIYLVMQYEVPSDVGGPYYAEAKAALQGGLVYKDFHSTYAPLFPYLTAVAIKVWNTPKSVVLLAIFIEAAAFPFWLKTWEACLGAEVLRTATLLYVFNPILISTVAIAGQNHIWIGALLGVSMYLLEHSDDKSAGAMAAVSVAATKFVALFSLPVLFFYSKRRYRFTTTFTLLTCAFYGLFLGLGANILTPVLFQRSQGQESSGNLPYLLSAFGINSNSPAYVLLALFAIGIIIAAMWRCATNVTATTERVYSIYWLVLLFLVIMLLSKKAYTTYLACIFYPLCVMWARQYGLRFWALVCFAGVSAVAAVEPTLWFRWINIQDLHFLQGAWQLPGIRVGSFLACEVVIVSSYVVLAATSVRELGSKFRAASIH